MIYTMCVENMDTDERESFDFELFATDDDKQEYEKQSRRDRAAMAAKYGAI